MLDEQPEVFQVTAENAPALWDTLQTPEDRRRTYNEREIPGAEIQRIFGDLPEQVADEQDRPHDALQQVIDGLSDGQEAIVRPLGELAPTGWDRIEGDIPTPLTATEKAFANRLLIVDRRCQYLQEQIKENHDTWAKLLELEAVQEDHGHSLDALFPLSQSFQRELAEIRAAQTADATEIGFVKGDIDDHDDRLDELELESKILQRQFDSLLMQRFTRRCIAGEVLRTIALAAFGFGIATFIGAAVSGSQQQKDDLANTGTLMTVIAVSATAIGTNLD